MTMTDKMKNILIGLFVAAAVTIMVSMILFLEPQIGDGEKKLYVRFANISGISVGTRVTFAGKPVGEVIAIHEIKGARSEPSDETGRVYFYQLTLKLDSSVDVYDTDELAIRTTGLMGERSVAILPKTAPQGHIPKLVNGEVVYASALDPLENTLQHITKAAHQLEGSVAHFDQWFQANSDTLSHALTTLDGALVQGETLLESVNHHQIVPKFSESTDHLNQSLQTIEISLTQDHLLDKVNHLVEGAHEAVNAFNIDGAKALQHIQEFTREIAAGTGTLGRLINGEDLYLRLGSILSKTETLMNDINHYGILFQYDKHWQRGRTKKANFLKALDSPKEFRDYFEGEVDAMTTSLGRLTELLEKAESNRETIVQSEVFKKQFSTLMRSVNTLSDSIRLYNEGLVASEAASDH